MSDSLLCQLKISGKNKRKGESNTISDRVNVCLTSNLPPVLQTSITPLIVLPGLAETSKIEK